MNHKNIFSLFLVTLFFNYMHHAHAMKPILHQEDWSKMIFDACQKGYLPEEIFDYIQQGGSFNIKSEKNYSPLHIACKCNHVDMVKFLLEHGANINDTMDGLLTPLHSSVLTRNIHVKIIQCLLDTKADLDAKTIHGHTALDLAYLIKDGKRKKAIIELFSLAIFKHSIANRPDADYTVVESLSPLHCSVINDDVVMTEYLLNVGADIDAQTIQGDTPLDFALLIENKTMVNLFPNHSSEESSS